MNRKRIPDETVTEGIETDVKTDLLTDFVIEIEGENPIETKGDLRVKDTEMMIVDEMMVHPEKTLTTMKKLPKREELRDN